MISTTISLIRHGTTTANEENRFAGRLPIPLSPAGRQEMTIMARGIPPQSFSKIYCSPLPRTRESAEIIAQKCAAKIEVAEELIDIDLPHWQGLTKEEIRQRFGDQYPNWLTKPATFHVPGCETLPEVQKRAMSLITRLKTFHPAAPILLVTHLIVARCLILATNQQSLADFRKIKVANGQVVTLIPSQYLDD